MPAWLPFANVFSIGDLLIGVGIAITVCRRHATEGGADRNRPHSHARLGTIWAMARAPNLPYGPTEGENALRQRSVQGKPVVRRGRKARDLAREAARLPVQRRVQMWR